VFFSDLLNPYARKNPEEVAMTLALLQLAALLGLRIRYWIVIIVVIVLVLALIWWATTRRNT
jgi:hypothetical protein